MGQKTRIKIENITIFLLVIVSIAMLVSSFITLSFVTNILAETIEMSRMVQRLFAVAMLLMTFHLYRRKRFAWIVVVVSLALSLVAHLLHIGHPVAMIIMMLKILILLVLLLFYKDFSCPSDTRSIRLASVFFGIGFVAIFANVLIGYHMLHTTVGSNPAIQESISYVISQLFQMQTNQYINTAAMEHGVAFLRFETLAFWLTWISAFIALYFIVRPILFKTGSSKSDKDRVRKLVLAYGQNPSAFLALEDDKTLYFSKEVEGVVAYGTIGDTMVVLGDPITEASNFKQVLTEFVEFATRTAHHVFFIGLTDEFIQEYINLGFGHVKCGEEARFDVTEYNIAGKKGQRMRSNVNHARNAGLVVKEYDVNKAHDKRLDEAFDRITKEWLEDKKSGELGFSVGGVGLDNPKDKRYFYAEDPSGLIQGIVVYTPFNDKGQRGYLADVTRRLHNAVTGITELIMVEAFAVFKEEGVKWGSMGVAPLANVIEDEAHATLMAKGLAFAYENLGDVYGFKSLHLAKEKYSPTAWIPSYFAYLPKIPTPSMLYAVIRIQNPQGIMDFVKSFLSSKLPKKQSNKEAKAKTNKDDKP